MEPSTPAAPAQPTATETVSASLAAVNAGDFDAFDRAELAARTGKPLPDVPVSAKADDAPAPDAPAEATADAPPASGQPERRLSKRQQETNEAIRAAVERATEDSNLRIAELEAQVRNAAPAKSPAPAAPAAPADKGTPEYKRIMALAGAPKLADFDSVEEHAFAAAAFIDDVRTKERETATRQRANQEALVASEKAADDAFFARLDEAKKADPEFVNKLAPEVAALTPLEWFARDAQGRPIDEHGQPVTTGPLNVVASEIRKSEVARDLMLHFSQHPEELTKFADLPASVAAIRDPRARLHAHVQHIVREFHRLEGRLAGSGTATPSSTAATDAPAQPPAPRSPITAAPPPPPTLRAAGTTSDPKAAALARGDFAEYDRLEMEERLAQRTPRR